GEVVGDARGEGADGLEVAGAVQGRDHMVAASAGGLHERCQTELGVEVARRSGHRVQSGQGDAGGRVEVDHQPVGALQVVRGGQGDVELDGGLVGQVDQGGGVLAHHVVDRAARALGYLDDAHPPGEVVRG